MILIGSKAIKHHYPDFKREPKDVDFAIDSNEFVYKKQGIEYLENPVLIKYFKDEPVLNSSALTTLKASHLFWNINWDKHMFDLQFLLSKGNKIDPNLFKDLYNFWNVYHGKNKRSDLKMSKEDFFTNAVNYDTMQHDEMHTILNPVPIYTTILKDGKEVELCELKFNKLSYEDKMNLIREEVMVMAYERFKLLGYKIAYSRMLKKFIISHAPEFTLIFILENYIELHKPKINFIKIIENGINRP